MVEAILQVGIGYVVVTIFISLLMLETHEPFEVAFWPLVLAKYLLKGLYVILFTGWRP